MCLWLPDGEVDFWPVAESNMSTDGGMISAESPLKHREKMTFLSCTDKGLLTVNVLVMTVDALGHFYTGQLKHSGRGWGM